MPKPKHFLSLLLTPAGLLGLAVMLNLMLALFTYRDYGYTWDEPLYYQYADAVGYAYSVWEWFDPDFDLNRSFGPSVYDHKFYGPAYILVGQAVRSGLKLFLPEQNWDLWRLVNFLCFQLGVVLLYRLSRRWLNAWAALAVGLLFTYQPLLWGMGFINPKDMPFMVFFIAALLAGFGMVDRLSRLFQAPIWEPESAPVIPWRVPLKKWRPLWLFVSAGLLAAIAGLYSDPMDRWIVRFIRYMVQAPTSNIPHKIFMRLAPGAASTPMETYANQALELFYRVQPGLALVCALLLLVPAGLLILPYFPALLARLELAVRARLKLPLWHLPASQTAVRQLTKDLLKIVLLPAVLLGALISIRVLGPFAGLLILVHFVLRHERRYWLSFFLYTLLAGMVSLALWPYLWPSPLARFIEVLAHMANNPQILSVLFNGLVYPTNAMPGNYLPVYLAITLSEPVWWLFALGFVFAASRFWRGRVERVTIALALAWFGLPFWYVLWRHPPMYDGFRHFLFMLPPVFIFAGFFFQALFEKLPRLWFTLPLVGLAILPGMLGIISMHPYEYTYYNQLVSGVGGAFRRFETDYWLTCYKDLFSQVTVLPASGVLYVLRQPANARLYAPQGLEIRRYDPDDDQTRSGDFLLLPTRANNDLQYHPEAPVVTQVKKNGAVFCLVKKIP